MPRVTRAAHGAGDFDYCRECGNYHEVPVAPECPIFAEKSKKTKSKTPRDPKDRPNPHTLWGACQRTLR